MDEGSGFRGGRRTEGLFFKEIKSASYSCPEQTPTESHPQHCLPPSHSGIATHSHVSLVVAADFLDSDVVLGVNERLGGGIGFCHGYYAGHVAEVVLVLNFDLDCQNPVQKWQGQQEQEYFVSRNHLRAWIAQCQLKPPQTELRTEQGLCDWKTEVPRTNPTQNRSTPFSFLMHKPW